MSYSDKKLNKSDEGGLEVKVYTEKGRVIVDFGKTLSWLGFDKKSLRNFIDGLEKYYQKI